MGLETKTSEGQYTDLCKYQARRLFEAHGVPASAGIVASTPQEAEPVARELGGNLIVVKTQVKTGGRSKARGVKLVRSPQEAVDRAEEILGIDTEDYKVRRMLVAFDADIAQEFYFPVLLDRSKHRYLAMYSVDRGVDIGTLAKEWPEALAKVAVDPNVGVDEVKARETASAAGFDAEADKKIVPVLLKLQGVYSGEDATFVKVNPLTLMEQNGVVALDGGVTLNDNAWFCHGGHEALVDKAAEGPLETKAKALGLNYVKPDSQVRVIGNGVGLVMSALDVVTYAREEYGMGPANFLNIGGRADANIMSNNLTVIPGGPDMRSVFVNVFGGITACDEVARGIIAALDALGEVTSRPIIVRPDGDAVTEGRAIFAQANHPLVTLISTADGATAEAAQLAAGSNAK